VAALQAPEQASLQQKAWTCTPPEVPVQARPLMAASSMRNAGQRLRWWPQYAATAGHRLLSSGSMGGVADGEGSCVAATPVWGSRCSGWGYGTVRPALHQDGRPAVAAYRAGTARRAARRAAGCAVAKPLLQHKCNKTV